MSRCLRKKGVPEEYVYIVQGIYRSSKTQVVTQKGDTEYFPIEVGIHQKSAMSAILFHYSIGRSNGKHREGSALGNDVRGRPGAVCYNSCGSGGRPGSMESCVWEAWAEDQQNKYRTLAEPHKWYRSHHKECWCWTTYSDIIQIHRVAVHEWGRFTGWCQQ